MATKHDAKRAQANMWVTHQNLARAKGQKAYQPRPRVQAVKKPAPAPPPAEPTTLEAEAAKKPGDGDAG